MQSRRDTRSSYSSFDLHFAGGLRAGVVVVVDEVDPDVDPTAVVDPELMDGLYGRFLLASDWRDDVLSEDDDVACFAWISFAWSAAAALRNSSSKSLNLPV